MADETRERWERQQDGSYHLNDDNPTLSAAVWGMARYWARRYGLQERWPEMKTRLMLEFPYKLFLEEGGCSHLAFPEKAARIVAGKLKNCREDELERERLSKN